MAWPVTSPRASKSNTSVFATLFTREKHSGSLGGDHQVIFPMATDDSPFTMLDSRREIQSFELCKKRLSNNLRGFVPKFADVSSSSSQCQKDKARQKTEASIFKVDGCMLRKLTEKRISHRREIPETEGHGGGR